MTIELKNEAVLQRIANEFGEAVNKNLYEVCKSLGDDLNKKPVSAHDFNVDVRGDVFYNNAALFFTIDFEDGTSKKVGSPLTMWHTSPNHNLRGLYFNIGCNALLATFKEGEIEEIEEKKEQ